MLNAAVSQYCFVTLIIFFVVGVHYILEYAVLMDVLCSIKANNNTKQFCIIDFDPDPYKITEFEDVLHPACVLCTHCSVNINGLKTVLEFSPMLMFVVTGAFWPQTHAVWEDIHSAQIINFVIRPCYFITPRLQPLHCVEVDGVQCLLEKCLLHGSLIGFYCLNQCFPTFLPYLSSASSVRLKYTNIERQCVILIN